MDTKYLSNLLLARKIQPCVSIDNVCMSRFSLKVRSLSFARLVFSTKFVCNVQKKKTQMENECHHTVLLKHLL